MACAIPIVATPVGIIPEIIINGVNGFIMKPEDSEGLSDIVIELFRDQEKAEAIGKAGRRTVEEMFFWENIGEQYIVKLESFIRQ
jgi:glycosyltransferase involved in cell wall biosynthesis